MADQQRPWMLGQPIPRARLSALASGVLVERVLVGRLDDPAHLQASSGPAELKGRVSELHHRRSSHPDDADHADPDRAVTRGRIRRGRRHRHHRDHQRLEQLVIGGELTLHHQLVIDRAEAVDGQLTRERDLDAQGRERSSYRDGHRGAATATWLGRRRPDRQHGDQHDPKSDDHSCACVPPGGYRLHGGIVDPHVGALVGAGIDQGDEAGWLGRPRSGAGSGGADKS